MDKGKKLEADCIKLFKAKEIWYHRFYDSRSAGGFLPPQPSDFLAITDKPFFIECKESEKMTIYASAFRPSQLKTMKEMIKRGINYYIIFLVNKRAYYCLKADDVFEALMEEKKVDLSEYIHDWSAEDAFCGILYK